MVRSGKERAAATDDDATQLSGNEAQRIAGRNANHVAAGQASGAKRKAKAMSEEESKRRKAAHKREVRAQKAAEKAAAAAADRAEAPANGYKARAAAAKAAREAARKAAAMVPSLDTFNRWFVQYDEPVNEEEYEYAFQPWAHVQYLEPEDCEEMAFVELFFLWRDSDDYKSYKRDLEIDELDQDAREPPPPVSVRGGPPRCVECRRNPCVCPAEPGDGYDDNPWQYEDFGHVTPPRTRSPDSWLPGFDWDDFCDREYARAAGELGWWGSNWGEASRPRADCEWEKQAEERCARKERERAAGPPPYREEPRFGPRGDTAGDELFRKERAMWYEKFTGRSIVGAGLQEQNELCDAIARRFRAYSDGRRDEAVCSADSP